jgi:hypothetical protein
MSPSIQQLQSQVQAMSGDRLKQVVLSWLASEERTIDEFEQLVENSGDYEWGKIDENQQFQPMTEDEMVAESLAAWAEYQKNPEGVPHDLVKRWAESLGQDDELLSAHTLSAFCQVCINDDFPA